MEALARACVESAVLVDRPDAAAEPLVDVVDVHHAFGRTWALRGVSLAVAPGEIHALLGPNGAGKTTLLRVLSGLVEPRGGRALVGGIDSAAHSSELKRQIGLVPSGDRSFYLRISGLENLVFFARMHGFSRREALKRARARLDDVGLAEAAGRPVYSYSHGMQKRLGVARALLADPPVLFVDEATHDLDPEGAAKVRRLVRDATARGAGVIWTTQRLDEIRGFADRVTLLVKGQVRFGGTVSELMSLARSRTYVVGLGHPAAGDELPLEAVQLDLRRLAAVTVLPGEAPHLRLELAPAATIGDAVAAVVANGVAVLSCREERSEVEQAFFALAGSEDPE